VLCCAGHQYLLLTTAGAGQALEQPTTTTQQVQLAGVACFAWFLVSVLYCCGTRGCMKRHQHS
jgi:hypothetical protein